MVLSSSEIAIRSSSSSRRAESRGGRLGTKNSAEGGTSAQPPRSLRGLVFEMTNVLHDATLWRREVVKLLARLGIPACYPAFFDDWDREYLSDVQCGFRQFEEAFQAFLLSRGLSWGQIDEIEAATRVRRQELEERVRPLPGVAATLAKLNAQGLPLALLTDSPYPAARLEKELDKLSLSGCFQSVLSSFDLEVTKPDPACYQAAIRALGVPAQELAFVGCDHESLAGAAACGLRTIAVNCQQAVSADAQLTRFSELLEIVERLSA